jgi:hypothetical protein
MRNKIPTPTTEERNQKQAANFENKKLDQINTLFGHLYAEAGEIEGGVTVESVKEKFREFLDDLLVLDLSHKNSKFAKYIKAAGMSYLEFEDVSSMVSPIPLFLSYALKFEILTAEEVESFKIKFKNKAEFQEDSIPEQSDINSKILSLVMTDLEGNMRTTAEIKKFAKNFWNMVIVQVRNGNEIGFKNSLIGSLLTKVGTNFNDFIDDYDSYLSIFSNPALLGDEVGDVKLQLDEALAKVKQSKSEEKVSESVENIPTSEMLLTNLIKKWNDQGTSYKIESLILAMLDGVFISLQDSDSKEYIRSLLPIDDEVGITSKEEMKVLLRAKGIEICNDIVNRNIETDFSTVSAIKNLKTIKGI